MKKAFLLSIVYTIGSIAISLAFKSLLSSIYPKTKLALFFTMVDIVSLFMLFFIGFRASMSVSYAKNKNLEGDILNALRIAIAVMCVVGFLVGLYIASKLPFSYSMFYLAALFVSSGIYAYFSNQLSMYRLYTLVNKTVILEPLFALIWFLTLYYLLLIQSQDALYISTILAGLTVAAYIFLAKKNTHKEPPITLPIFNSEFKSFLKNSALGGAEFLFGMLILYFATLFIGYTLPIDALGDFQVVVKSFFMYYIAIFVFPIVKFTLPELSVLVNAKEVDKIKKLNIFTLKYSVAAAVFVTIFSILFAEPVISALFGSAYKSAAASLTIMSSALFFVSINTYQVALLKSMDRFFLSMSIRACGTLFFAVFAFLCYSASPTLEAVCVALTLGYASMSALSFWLSKKELRRHFKEL